MRREAQHQDAELRAFIRAYQRRALSVGKAKAVAEIEAKRAGAWVLEPKDGFSSQTS